MSDSTVRNADAMAREKDVAAIEDHARRVLERMRQTPHGPKRKLLAQQHVSLCNAALEAKGWNDALAALSPADGDAGADYLAEARKRLTLTENCLDCNVDDDRFWRGVVSFLEGKM